MPFAPGPGGPGGHSNNSRGFQQPPMGYMPPHNPHPISQPIPHKIADVPPPVTHDPVVTNKSEIKNSNSSYTSSGTKWLISDDFY